MFVYYGLEINWIVLRDLQEGCVNKCADKFLKHSERVGARFAELSQNVSMESP